MMFKKIYQSPFWSLIILGLSFFFAEVSVMILLSIMPSLPTLVEGVLDSLLLIFLASPMLYFFQFRPLIIYLAERKKSEEALRRSEQALKESEKKYRMLIENIQDGFFVIQDSKIQFANDAFAMVAGYTVDEVIGKDLGEFVAPEDMEMVRDPHHQKNPDGSDAYEFHMLHRDGKTRIAINMCAGFINYRGRAANMGTVKDVTNWKEKEEFESQLLQSDKFPTMAGGVEHGAVLEKNPEILDSNIIKAISNPIRRDIVKLIDKKGKIKFSEINNFLNINDSTKLSFHLRVLKSYNIIEQNSEKIYILTPMGRKLMENLRRIDR